MALELKHVVCDELTDLDTSKLVEIAADANAILAGVKAELLRQEQERRQALVAAGLAEATPSQASPVGGAKRGRKPKAATEPNGHADDAEEIEAELIADA